MKITVRAKNLKLNKTLSIFIQEKLGSLEKFTSILGREGELSVDIEKETKHHRKGPYFKTKAQLRFPSRILEAKASREDLRSSIIEVKDELQREVERMKNKILQSRKMVDKNTSRV